MEHYKNHKGDRKTTVTKCKNCGTEFLAKSTLAKFCGSSCKQDDFLKNKAEKIRKENEEKIQEFSDTIEGLELLKELSNNSPDDLAELDKCILMLKAKTLLMKGNIYVKNTY
jgi:endogenous inhibitor of DNA gyrase (YacG/DUF329 family)